MTYFELVWGLVVAAISAALSWFVARQTMRAQKASDAHVAAVHALLPAIVPLRALLHEWGLKQHAPRDVASAVTVFEEVCLQHQVALPRSVCSVRRNVRAALGNYFGGASLAGVDAEMADFPLAKFHPYWQDISQSYLEYVMSELQISVVNPRADRMRSFHEWRKEEDRASR